MSNNIKQIHCVLDILSTQDLKSLTSFQLNDVFTHITIDIRDFYYFYPPLLLPIGTYCFDCEQEHQHLPSCKTQKTKDYVYFTVEGLNLRGLPFKDTDIDHDNRTLLTYVTKKKGRPPKQKKDVHKKRFPNSVELSVKMNTNTTSIKISDNQIRFMSMPTDKKSFMFVINETISRLSPFMEVNPDVNIQNIYVQYDLKPFPLQHIYQTPFTNDILHLNEKQLLPSNQLQFILSKGISLKYVDVIHRIKYSFMIFKTGIVQIFISKCLDRDVKNKYSLCDKKTDISLFDIDQFTFTTIIKKTLEMFLNEFTGTRKESFINNNNRLDNKKPYGCRNMPSSYSFYTGKCSKMDHHIPFFHKYPCCMKTNKNNDMKRYMSLPLQHKTSILRGNISNNGYGYINNKKVFIKHINNNKVILNDDTEIKRSELDTEMALNPYKHMSFYTNKDFVMFIKEYFPILSSFPGVLKTFTNVFLKEDIANYFYWKIDNDVYKGLSVSINVPYESVRVCIMNTPKKESFVIDIYGNTKRIPYFRSKHAVLSRNGYTIERGYYYDDVLYRFTDLSPKEGTMRVYVDSNIISTNRIRCPFLSYKEGFGNRKKVLFLKKHKIKIGIWCLFEKIDDEWYFIASNIKEPIFLEDTVLSQLF